jgi:hypothetical protein
MSHKPCTASIGSKLRHHLRNSVEGSRKRFIVCIVGLVVIATGTAIADIYLPNLFPFLNLTGFSGTYSSTGNVDLSGPFFQSLGTNGRSCATCHQPSDAFGLSAANAQLRYLISGGRDPLFDQVDGSTCPTGPINNSLVLNNGLIRVGLTVPPNTTGKLPRMRNSARSSASNWLSTRHNWRIFVLAIYREEPTAAPSSCPRNLFIRESMTLWALIPRESLSIPTYSRSTHPSKIPEIRSKLRLPEASRFSTRSP